MILSVGLSARMIERLDWLMLTSNKCADKVYRRRCVYSFKQSTAKQEFMPKKLHVQLTNWDMAEVDVSEPDSWTTLPMDKKMALPDERNHLTTHSISVQYASDTRAADKSTVCGWTLNPEWICSVVCPKTMRLIFGETWDYTLWPSGEEA